MRDEDREPLATIALIAAFADGFRAPEEVERLKQIATEIGGSDYDTLARQILSGRSALKDVVARLSDDDAKRKAYELATAVIHADGVANKQEQDFLVELKRQLALPDEANAAATAETAAGFGAAAVTVSTAPPVPGPQVDDLILDSAILTAALELLPQNLATMAIVPLQLRMVYQVGQRHGQRLDGDQVKDLAAVFGIGAAGQVMEGMARRLLGGIGRGLLGRSLGGAAGGVGGAAAGIALTFATTYALGHAATRYYGQDRNISQQDLRDLFDRLKDEAATIFPRIEDRIRERARSLDLPQVLAKIRGA